MRTKHRAVAAIVGAVATLALSGSHAAVVLGSDPPPCIPANPGNLGTGNSGAGNLGNDNVGSGNVGSNNTGYGNVGNRNTGSGNTVDGNTGYGDTPYSSPVAYGSEGYTGPDDFTTCP